MNVSDFDYELPASLIADFPTERRSASRLLVVSNEGENPQFKHLYFSDLPTLLSPNDLLIFNNTKVIPARLFAQKTSGGKIEILIERLLENNKALVQLRASRAPKNDSVIQLINHQAEFRIIGRKDNFFIIELLGHENLTEVIEQAGHLPLPPYIQREATQHDLNRYQTIFAKHAGAVAAPTAGLHFDELLFEQLNLMGMAQAFVTLHVGSGTFKPVKVDNIVDHKMHSEVIELPQATVDKIIETNQNNGRVICVGTTSMRVLEAVAKQCGKIQAYRGETDIFIYPGYRFQCVDALITNFHLPKSTLLMLVSAFVGKDTIMQAYQQAIAEKYRFFSYGDAMFLNRNEMI